MRAIDFDVNGVTIPNGRYFGSPFTVEAAKVVLLSVPWDVTTSYGGGAAQGPQAILDASCQLDWYDPDVAQAWTIARSSLPINAAILSQNHQIKAIAQQIIQHLETGGSTQASEIQSALAIVNQASAELNNWVQQQAQSLLAQGQFIGLVGGDHSAPLGLMRALAAVHDSYGILHIDAHADLREAFEGFTYSHASIMHNALKIAAIGRLVQVGIRDVCEAEMQQIQQDERIILFDDWQLKANAFGGMTWATQVEKIITALPQQVYISFDIDGLDPRFCPHTGTPVPGGLTFNEAIYLCQALVKSGRRIIGFDLCEVAPDPNGDEWDGNVGARLLYKLSNLMYLSHWGQPAP